MSDQHKRPESVTTTDTSPATLSPSMPSTPNYNTHREKTIVRWEEGATNFYLKTKPSWNQDTLASVERDIKAMVLQRIHARMDMSLRNCGQVSVDMTRKLFYSIFWKNILVGAAPFRYRFYKKSYFALEVFLTNSTMGHLVLGKKELCLPKYYLQNGQPMKPEMGKKCRIELIFSEKRPVVLKVFFHFLRKY